MNPQPTFSPEAREQLAQALLELHFGCHDDPASLQARLAAEPALRELQREVLAQARLLETAVKPATPPILLPTTATPAPAARRQRWYTLHRPTGRLLTAAALAAATLLATWWHAAWSQAAHLRFQQEHLHLTVSAPQAVPAGATWSFTAQTRDLTGAPIDGKISWEAFDAQGVLLAASAAGTSRGHATVAMAATPDLRVPQRVVVTATTATDRVVEVLTLSTAAAGPLVHVTTDRPVYRPGESVFCRAVLLDRVTQQPLPDGLQLVAQLLDGRGAAVARDNDATDRGVGSFVLPVPDTSAGGPHTLEVRDRQGRVPPESIAVTVRPFQTPQLATEIVLDRTSYAPGQRGTAQVRVERIAAGGGPANGARATGILVIDGVETWRATQPLGGAGDTTFRFVVPSTVQQGAARFVATIDDGGIVATAVKPFVVPTGTVLLAAFPAGGELVAGVDNTVYLECTDSLGRPIDGAGELRDDRDRRIATFRTVHQGRARLAFRPAAGASYHVRLTGHQEPFPLPAVQPRGIAMDLPGDDIAANAPLRLRLAGRGDGPWLLGVFCRGVLVGQTTVRADATGELRAEAEVGLPAAACGVLRATVFDRNLQPVAERLLRRRESHRLELDLALAAPGLSPGQRQQLTVRTTDERGQPVPAVVGVSASDLAALSLGSEPRIGLLDHALLFADVGVAPERLEAHGDFFVKQAASATHVDLLLGTRGWRRFVWRNDASAQAAIAARGKAGDGVLPREGFSHTPQVHSNLQAASAAGSALAQAAAASERRVDGLARWLLLVLLLLAVGEATCWCVPRAMRRAPLPTSLGLVGAAASVFAVVALLWSQREMVMAPTSMLREDFDGVAVTAPFPPGGGAAQTEFSLGAPERKLSTRDFDVELTPEAAFDSGAWSSVVNPLAGAFFNDGGPGDVRPKVEQGQAGGLLPMLAEPEPDLRQRLSRRSPAARQYAHRYETDGPRADFTATVLWQTLVVTDARGEAKVEFDTSDAATTWVVHAEAHTATGTGRLGQAEQRFTTRLPLQLEAKLPDEVSAGDRLLLPITAVAVDASITQVDLVAAVGPGLQLGPEAPRSITLQQGRGRALVPLVVGDAPGSSWLRLAGRIGRSTDRLQRSLTIVPRGFPHRRSQGGSIAPGTTASVTLVVPSDAVPGSGRATLKAYPSPLSTLRAGLDGMLQEPHGCFEQTSSTNYPNTLVLQLLGGDGDGDSVPVAAQRARDLLAKGYARLTGFECKQGGFEWFGRDPGHEALTAYGLLQFHDMAKVFPVEAAMVVRTQQWLLGRRDRAGNFVHAVVDHHSFGGRSQTLTNAYCVYALLQSGTPASELGNELAALRQRATVDDAYELALLANALRLAGDTTAAAVRERLASLQRPDGSLQGTTSSITCSSGRDLAVETTGFAVLAWLGDARYAAQVRQAIEFLQGCRNAGGTFGATQATVCALRAMAAYATSQPPLQDGGLLRVRRGDELLAERTVSPDAADALQLELWAKLAPGEQTLALEFTQAAGTATPAAAANLPWSLDVSYHAELPADDAAAPVAITTSLRAGDVVEGDPVALDITVTNTTEREQPTPIAIVGLPAGLELPTRVLEDLQRSERFAHWELRGRDLVLYWRTLAPGAEQRLVLDLVARVPGRSTGAASRSYLYYTPGAVHWAAPLVVTIAAR